MPYTRSGSLAGTGSLFTDFSDIARPPHIFRAAYQRGENLVVVLATAQVSRNAERQFATRGLWICFEETYRRHDETGHAKCALEALFVDDALLDRMQLSLGARQPLDGQDLSVAHSVCQHRARIMRHIVDKNRARATFGPVAAKLRSCESQFVAQGPGQRFLSHDIRPPQLSVHIDRNEPFT